jgi:hypothetical protein
VFKSIDYRFYDRFFASIQDGTKNATIRSTAKGAQAGSAMTLLPLEGSKPIGYGVIRSVFPIQIIAKANWAVAVSGLWLPKSAAHGLAARTGFEDLGDMLDFVKAHYKTDDWSGYLHTWNPAS